MVRALVSPHRMGMRVGENRLAGNAEGLRAATEPLGIAFDNSYARLPSHFYARVSPVPVREPRLLELNVGLANYLGLDPVALASGAGVDVLAGNAVGEGSEPIALAYAGHQFGHFVPLLGDGRANLIGEVLANDGSRFDLQLKGSGPTPYSRRGDGRAALGPVLREYILSESMAALGVQTTRALAALTTGDLVRRETAQPGAIFVRVASSHLRVGTFQYMATRGDLESLRTLADYAIARHYPEAALGEKPYGAFLAGVIGRQAEIVAQWMLLGFVHGVMNTDNTSISGETIDYGPCAFLESYDPNKVFSSIDHQGRYGYANQPLAMHWNMTRMAESLLPLLTLEEGSEKAGLAVAEGALELFPKKYQAAREKGLARKLGLIGFHKEYDFLGEDLLKCMAENRADFTLTFRLLSTSESTRLQGEHAPEALGALFDEPEDLDRWYARWTGLLQQQGLPAAERITQMEAANPAVIPRNHFVQRVIEAAVNREDFEPFRKLLGAVSQPFQSRQEFAEFEVPASPEEWVHATFCGT